MVLTRAGEKKRTWEQEHPDQVSIKFQRTSKHLHGCENRRCDGCERVPHIVPLDTLATTCQLKGIMHTGDTTPIDILINVTIRCANASDLNADGFRQALLGMFSTAIAFPCAAIANHMIEMLHTGYDRWYPAKASHPQINPAMRDSMLFQLFDERGISLFMDQRKNFAFDKEMCDMLINRGANMQWVLQTCRVGKKNFNVLIDYANAKGYTKFGANFVRAALWSDDIEKNMQKLQSYGCDTDAIIKRNKKFVIDAVRHNCLDIVEYLLDHGANFNILYSKHKRSILHHALIPQLGNDGVYEIRIQMIRLLVQRGVNVNFRGMDKDQALHECIRHAPVLHTKELNTDNKQLILIDQITESIHLLINHGADSNGRGMFSDTPLKAAHRRGATWLVPLLTPPNETTNQPIDTEAVSEFRIGHVNDSSRRL